MKDNFLKNKNFFWIFPLLAGIISLIGLIIPAWYSKTSFKENLWIVGIIEHIFWDGSIFEILPPELFMPSLITTIFVSISSIMIIGISVLFIKGKKFLVKAEILWLIMGIIQLCALIIYINAMVTGFYNYTQRTDYSIHNFWAIYNFNFGLIFPFVGSILSIVGAIIYKMSS